MIDRATEAEIDRRPGQSAPGGLVESARPQVIVIAGPNGSGKSTCASTLVPEGTVFLNADEIAKGLPGYPSRKADFEAGRRLLGTMDELEREGLGFALEATLASRSFGPRLARLRRSGYEVRLLFVWLPSADLAVRRVAARVRVGGHDIPELTIRRRFTAGLENFFNLYRPIADRWEAYDNSRLGDPVLIAEGDGEGGITVHEPDLWRRMRRGITLRDRVKYALSRWSAAIEQILHAMKRATWAALHDHKRAGNPVAVWRDGRVVEVPPEEIEVPDEPEQGRDHPPGVPDTAPVT